jgi:DNA-binding MarR family transcriptional regulator
MKLEEVILRVQTAYPRIYLACHTKHQTPRVTGQELSQRDSAILAHLNEGEPMAQSLLTRHLGIGKSTLSEALTWLEQRGLIARETGGSPRRAQVRRTTLGSATMSKSSVLERDRLRMALASLTRDDRQRVVDGLELFAHAALAIPKGEK